MLIIWAGYSFSYMDSAGFHMPATLCKVSHLLTFYGSDALPGDIPGLLEEVVSPPL